MVKKRVDWLVGWLVGWVVNKRVDWLGGWFGWEGVGPTTLFLPLDTLSM